MLSRKEYKKMNNKKLYRSRSNRIFLGVCGGIGDYFGIDPTVVRAAWIIFCALGGSGLIAYLLIALFMPEEP